ncbi:hypothetical protein SDRG_03359 [Saprolegnia diclina VS20]|uniref:DUF6604 domain-containing protein n=1 Tax=Saprolegnia diclina (strain VS20) TaxID=1156394 RepID=T0S2G0_SAPDV|nr:hypothetical protein SDRG_03359 [Saprolegnia diclina VS20]EQC39153.1 hypothetical protein SDRG_03359 [Saprolegnia diclina VS20]|eukprot:XP_008607214.1 hypothetical protein SDRG_03359 [Saprolegnia diclina VS20]
MTSRWHQYKAATDAVVSWLQRVTSTATTKKKKQKATTTPGAWTTKQIWAAALDVADKGLLVPAHIWTELSTSIRLRWMATRSLPPDAGHMHFLDLLRAIRSKLAPRRPPTATRRTTAAEGGLSNPFKVLADEDDEDDDMPHFDATAYSPPVQTLPADARVAQLADDQFRATCFVLDMDELMGEVHAVWAAFKQGETTLLAATAVTNHCVRVVESLASELCLELPYLKTLGDVGVLLGKTPLAAFLLSHSDLSMGDTVDWCLRADDHRIPLDDLVATMAHTLGLPEDRASLLQLAYIAALRSDWTQNTRHFGGDNHLGKVYNLLAMVAPILQPGTRIAVTSRVAWDEATAPATSTKGLHDMLFFDVLVPLLTIAMRQTSDKNDGRYGKCTGATLRPYVTLLRAYGKTKVASTELVFATQCLLVSILAVQGPPEDAITCASVAASTVVALKQSYRHVLLGLQRPNLITEHKRVFDADAETLRFALWAATKDDESSAVARTRAWLNPWMAGQWMLDVVISAHLALGYRAMDDMRQTTVVLHAYNALRIVGRMPSIPALEAISDLCTRGSQFWVGGRPSARGGFATAFKLSIGAATIHNAGEVWARDAGAAKQRYHDQKDRRSKLQKAYGVAQTRAVKRLTITTKLSRSLRLLFSVEEPTDLADLRRTLDAEWHAFLHLDLVHVGNVLRHIWFGLQRRFGGLVEPVAANDVFSKATVTAAMDGMTALMDTCDAGADDLCVIDAFVAAIHELTDQFQQDSAAQCNPILPF